ncbi:Glutamyl-tRNA(Gln) amidotransferase subunit A, mitochondrial [Venustampulla echinocandica]|uniref:Glutamyl-tRNA(Gln) amidotransferase subunit A, mitochondrial n=1 Tax=Venustampulla echinocandica TaxID=2656787 RepID=A0A370U1C0_9HELO|nr:Glutamyl-tRNA(Gln) amidotransferase subunit A, mitochondrial [Venustampulla echinocandica]RDL41576.1 Glutamyl-tRNA(Gln) amidotransferase subunit A, mitochondrial [Venustampulla echinocandica]
MWPPAPVVRRAARLARVKAANATQASRLPALDDLKNITSNSFISFPNSNTNTKNGDLAESPSDAVEESGPEKTSPSLARPLPNSIAVKDNIATADLPTTCGSGILRGYQSPFQAFVIEQARAYGGEVTGKTNLDEFGMGSHSTHSFFGPVRNKPPFEDFSAGGSSGGSAVAVAQGLCEVALGTDTGGSIRLPAAYTKTIGFKPSYGLLSRRGVVPYANSLDTVGILSQSTKIILKTFLQLGQHDIADPSTLPPKSRKRIAKWHAKMTMERRAKADISKPGFANLKIGVPIEYNIAELDPAIRRAWQNALTLFQEQGCTVVPVSLPNTKHALSAYYVLAPAEAASNLSKYDGIRYGTRSQLSDGAGDVLYSYSRGEGFGDEVKRRILLGSYTLSSEAIDNYFIKAQKIRRLVQRDFDRVFSISNPLRPPQQFDLSDMDDSVLLPDKLGPCDVDFIVCPTAPTTPPTLDDISKQTSVDAYMNDVFTVPASLAGLPAISVPYKGYFPSGAFRNPDAPNSIGIQIIGQYSDDVRVIATAHKFLQLQEDKANSRLRDNNFRARDKKLAIKEHKASRSMVKFTPSEEGILSRNVKISKHFSGRSMPKSLDYLLIRKMLQEVKITKYPSRKGLILQQQKSKAQTDREFAGALAAWDQIMH